MAQRGTFTKMMGLAMAGAMTLAACGGGDSDSRTRNAAAADDCYVSSAVKDGEILAAQTRRDEAARARADLARLLEESSEAGRLATAKWAEFSALPAVVRGNTETDEELADLDRIGAEHEVLLKAARAANRRYADASALASTVGLIDAELAEIEATPLCGDGAASPDTSTSTDSSTANTSATDTDSPETTSSETTSPETTTPAPETTTVAPESTSTTEPASVETASAPCVGTPVEGTNVVATVDEPFDLSFVLCKAANGMSLSGPADSVRAFRILGTNRNENTVSYRFSVNATGSFRMRARQVNRAGSETFVSDFAEILVNVNERAPSDECTDKAPDVVWNAETNEFRANATCFPVDALRISVLKGVPGTSRPEVVTGAVPPGVRLRDFLSSFSSFGPGQYQVNVIHARFGPTELQLVGLQSTTAIEIPEPSVTDQTDASSPGTVTNGEIDVPSVRDGVVNVPTAVLTDVESASDGNIPTSVVAVPEGTTTITCDATCLASIAERAGVDASSVEISVGDAPWSALTAASAVALPGGASTVRVRVTPTSGDAVVLAVKMTRETTTSIDDIVASEGVAELDTTGVVETTGDDTDGGSLLWVILAGVCVVIAGGALAWRRRGVGA